MKRAIVIGASSGIGKEVAKLLLQEGWTLGVAARRVELLQTIGAAAVEQIDVTAYDAAKRLHSLIDRLGGMDLFFYASGIGKQNRELKEGPRVQKTRSVVQAADASANGERDIHRPGHPAYQLRKGLAAFNGGADVKIYQLIGPVKGVFTPKFHGVAHIFQANEVDTFDYPSVLDVQAGYYPFCKHADNSLSVIRFS